MKLNEMTLQQVLNGLRFEYKGNNTVVVGNDDDKTLYIRNITKDEFNDIVNFDIRKLKSKNKKFNSSFKELRAEQNIERYIIPKIEQAKNEK